jgi:1-acyl-sn-glycerol-3-phosphate acyltransferase
MKNWWWYYLRFWVKLAIKLFYRRIEIHGTDTYPAEGPVFLAPNHQNAFMDALIPSVFAPRPIHFLARADVFQKKWLAAFLRSINMMPVYRQRDGITSLGKNEEIFELCYKILRDKGTLLIFPEATHLGERRLRPLSKGFTRVLFGAMENHEDLPIKVVPLGLNYSHYHKSGARLIVNYGKPIDVSLYQAAYRINAPRAMARLRSDVQKALSEEIVHPGPQGCQRCLRD